MTDIVNDNLIIANDSSESSHDELEQFRAMPADEILVEFLDMVIWNLSGHHDIPVMRSELAKRPDASNVYVQRAIAVCDEYLAPYGSPEAIDAKKRAWPED